MPSKHGHSKCGPSGNDEVWCLEHQRWQGPLCSPMQTRLFLTREGMRKACNHPSDVVGDRHTINNHAIKGKEPLFMFSRALRATLLDLTASDFCMMLIGEPVSESKKLQSQLEYQCQEMGEERGVLVKCLMQ